ncbi:Uncharacterised protein [Mycobacteroides abscessus subsp. massiliense]|nr:Uncharacterised protein [Mycobacteroides abscessus subsp. massiliense]
MFLVKRKQVQEKQALLVFHLLRKWQDKTEFNH